MLGERKKAWVSFSILDINFYYFLERFVEMTTCRTALLGISLILFHLIYCSESAKPNILIFLVDDLGYGDTGAYGNSTIESPHIDSLARDGARYTQMYSAAPICTPSRGGLLTGRYPIRLGLTSDNNRLRTFNSPAQPGGLPHDEITMAEVAQSLGYRTGIVGKWHLGLGRNGEHLPTHHGFDSFFGMPVTNVQTCGNKKIYNLIGGHGEVLDRSLISYWISQTGRVSNKRKYYIDYFRFFSGVSTIFCNLHNIVVILFPQIGLDGTDFGHAGFLR